MALGVQAIKTLIRTISETRRAKYETAPVASQKIEPIFGYLKIR
jgi:hypothetical protein